MPMTGRTWDSQVKLLIPSTISLTWNMAITPCHLAPTKPFDVGERNLWTEAIGCWILCPIIAAVVKPAAAMKAVFHRPLVLKAMPVRQEASTHHCVALEEASGNTPTVVTVTSARHGTWGPFSDRRCMSRVTRKDSLGIVSLLVSLIEEGSIGVAEKQIQVANEIAELKDALETAKSNVRKHGRQHAHRIASTVRLRRLALRPVDRHKVDSLVGIASRWIPRQTRPQLIAVLIT